MTINIKCSSQSGIDGRLKCVKLMREDLMNGKMCEKKCVDDRGLWFIMFVYLSSTCHKWSFKNI